MENFKYNTKIQINITEILQLKQRLREINEIPLNLIEFIDENGDKIEIQEKALLDFQYTGLNNCDFITTGFYLSDGLQLKF